MSGIFKDFSQRDHDVITKIVCVLTRVNKVGKRGSNISSPEMGQHHRQYSPVRLLILNKWNITLAVIRL